MSTAHVIDPSLTAAIQANLRYYEPPSDGSKPWIKQYPDPNWNKPGLPTNVQPKEHRLPIYDLRPLVDQGKEHLTSVDTTGFQVVPKDLARTDMKYEDWNDEQTITSKYYAEVEALLKNVTGASRVVIFDHTIRRGERSDQWTPDTPDNRKPVPMVHVDQTPESGRNRVIRHTGDDAERLLKGKAQLINVWRPLRGPVKDIPLAYADARTLSKSQLVPSDLIYEDRVGETFQVAFSDNHRFYYLSDMSPQEAVLLKCWDNTPDGGNITPHTAFMDERYYGKEDIPLRQSIEIRALVFHE